MKRSLIVLITILLIIGAATFLGGLFAAPIETEALVPPSANPSVISPDIPTFVTFHVFIADPDVKSPKLQFFDPSKGKNGKWKTIRKLRNDGKFEDSSKGDQSYNLRVHFLDSIEGTQVSLPGNRKPIHKGLVPPPVELRIAARKNGIKGILVSPIISLPTVNTSLVTIGSADGDPPASVEVPATFDNIDASNPADIRLEKSGEEGYTVRIVTGTNTMGLSLEKWIFIHAYGYIEPGTPSSFSDDASAEVEPITISGLSGLKVTRTFLGTETAIFLEDPANNRIFWFNIFGSDPEQDLNLIKNIDEALSIVQSLQI